MLKRILLLLIIISSLQLRAGDINLSFAAGYKSNYSTAGIFIFGYDFTERLRYEIGPALSIFYNGMGATTGFKWSFISAKKYAVSLNADYQFIFNRSISHSFENKTKEAAFLIPNMHHVFLGTSFSYIIKNPYNKSYNKDRVSLNVCYGFPAGDYKAKFAGGEYDPGLEKKINNHIKQGIGLSLSYTAYFY
jgi:hypothetical protein